jgi:CRISPR-associated exonuclease Cas4
MPWLILTLFVLAIVLLRLGAVRRDSAGLPGGQIVYSDTRTWGPVEQPLYDPVWDLTGKPDYLIRQGRTVIPVEVKTGRTPAAPYDSHIYQLAAYCLLVERVMDVRPAYGLIKYPGRTYRIDYTASLENSLKGLLDEIRMNQRARSLDRSHEDPVRCRSCGFAATCDQRL